LRNVVLKMQLFRNEDERRASEIVLGSLLETLTRANAVYLQATPSAPNIYQAGVRYARERPKIKGAPIPEVWKTIPYCIADREADCEDLAAWLASQYRVRQGIAAKCVFTYRKRGNFSVYHIMVKLPDGRIEDPSVRLGMKAII
jgi:hypothetical protein